MRRTLHCRLVCREAALLEAAELERQGQTVVVEDADGERIEQEPRSS
jgi:hypothetical protein